MREILFRGKRKDNNKWIYGNLYHQKYYSGHRYFIIKRIGIVIDDNKVIDMNIIRAEEIIPETVGQYTGIKDKDGKKIFEGDLITFHTEYEMDNDDVWYEKEPYLVKWDNEIAGFEPFYLNGRWRCDIVNLRIVGNKWDNPELLEGKDD